jgi:hypothetical protein
LIIVDSPHIEGESARGEDEVEGTARPLEKTYRVEENLFGLLPATNTLSILLVLGPCKRDRNLRWLAP